MSLAVPVLSSPNIIRKRERNENTARATKHKAEQKRGTSGRKERGF